MLDWAAVHGGYIMIKRFGFPLLICAAFHGSSSLNSAHAVSKGLHCNIFGYSKPCDTGLSCTPLNMVNPLNMGDGICCARSEEPRPAVRDIQGRVVIWKCVRKIAGVASLPCWARGGVVGKDYNTHQLFCDTGSPRTESGLYICRRHDGGYSCCRPGFQSCEPEGASVWPYGTCRPWAGR
jgi:hypothetical protein